MAKSQFTLSEVESKFPVGSKVVFTAGRSPNQITGTVKGVRQAGVEGTRGHSIFVETVENRGDNLKAKERSIRPGSLELAGT